MKSPGKKSADVGNYYAASVTKKLKGHNHELISKLLRKVTKQKERSTIDSHATGGAAAVKLRLKTDGMGEIKRSTYVGDSPAEAGKADTKIDFLNPNKTAQLEIKYLNLSKSGRRRRASERNSSVASFSRDAGFDHEVLRKAEAEHKLTMSKQGYSLTNMAQSHREYKQNKGSKSPVFNDSAKELEASNRKFRESITYGLHWHLKSMSSDELHNFITKHLNKGVDGNLYRLTTHVPTPDGRGEVQHHINNPAEDLKKVLDYHKGWLGTSGLNQNSTKIHIYGKTDAATNKPVKLFTFDVVGKGRPTTPPGIITSSKVAEEAARIDGKKVVAKRVIKYGQPEEGFVGQIKRQRKT